MLESRNSRVGPGLVGTNGGLAKCINVPLLSRQGLKTAVLLTEGKNASRIVGQF